MERRLVVAWAANGASVSYAIECQRFNVFFFQNFGQANATTLRAVIIQFVGPTLEQAQQGVRPQGGTCFSHFGQNMVYPMG